MGRKLYERRRWLVVAIALATPLVNNRRTFEMAVGWYLV
jgi:hypothetical protein